MGNSQAAIVLLLGAILIVLVAGRTAFLDACGIFFWIALACFVVYVPIFAIRCLIDGFKQSRARGEPWIYKLIGYPGVGLILLLLLRGPSVMIRGLLENSFPWFLLSIGFMGVAIVVREVEERRQHRRIVERGRSTDGTAKAFTDYLYTTMGRPEGERHNDDGHRVECMFQEALERYDKGDRQ
jgi:hypothetical protein